MNSIFFLTVHRSQFGVWSFTDKARGLLNEPFVGMVNTFLDSLADGAKCLGVLFSAAWFPDAMPESLRLVEEGEPGMGSTYTTLDGQELWFCPALLKFFPEPPAEIWFAVRGAKARDSEAALTAPAAEPANKKGGGA